MNHQYIKVDAYAGERIPRGHNIPWRLVRYRRPWNTLGGRFNWQLRMQIRLAKTGRDV